VIEQQKAADTARWNLNRQEIYKAIGLVSNGIRVAMMPVYRRIKYRVHIMALSISACSMHVFV